MRLADGKLRRACATNTEGGPSGLTALHRHDLHGDVSHLPVLLLGLRDQHSERSLVGAAGRSHDRSFRLLDHASMLSRGVQVLDLFDQLLQAGVSKAQQLGQRALRPARSSWSTVLQVWRTLDPAARPRSCAGC